MDTPSAGSANASRRNNPTHSDSASVASQRLHALATLSGSLTDALHPREAVDLVEQKALAALGADSAVVVTLGLFPPRAGLEPDNRLHLVHAIGVPAEVVAALRELPLDAPIPFAEVARSGDPLFLESPDDLHVWGDWAVEMMRAGAQSAAIVPVWANGELRGVLGLSWPAPRLFDDDERAFVLTLGVMCAQAILRAYLRAAELEAREMAEHANRAKADFLAMISHELRTPMNAVMGYNELILRGLDGPVTPLQSDHLERVRESSAHLLELIEELLGYARLEAGRDEVRPERVQLPEMIERAVAIVRPLAEKKGLRIGFEYPEGPLEVYTDPRKLRQILVNLLANAVKFTHSGEINLIVHVEAGEADRDVVFEIVDTGPGIAVESQPHLFDAFWQSQPGSESGNGGTGLGLPIARRLADLLGARVDLVASSEASGSTFRLVLPARDGVAHEIDALHE